MIFVSVVGICIAVAGFVGYKNKDTIADTITWNGLKLFSTLKGYYETYQEGFAITNIYVYICGTFTHVANDKWEQIDLYMIGFGPTTTQKHNMILENPALEYDPKFIHGSLGISYIVDGKNYSNLYLCDEYGVNKYINDIDKLKENTYEIDTIQRILSATYYNGQIIEDMTELLQMFNISGDFYDNNKTFTFADIIMWHCKLSNPGGFCEKIHRDVLDTYNTDQYIEIIDICGNCQMFGVNDVITFVSE